jgi:hypothetical protein
MSPIRRLNPHPFFPEQRHQVDYQHRMIRLQQQSSTQRRLSPVPATPSVVADGNVVVRPDVPARQVDKDRKGSDSLIRIPKVPMQDAQKVLGRCQVRGSLKQIQRQVPGRKRRARRSRASQARTGPARPQP